MDKKGLNFMVGVGALWLLWRLYSSGFLHDVGFMTINQVTGQEFSYSYSGDQVMYSTPIAAIAGVIIDLVTVLGGLIIVLLTGLWDVGKVAVTYTVDLFMMLKAYVDNYFNRDKEEEQKPIPVPTDPLLEIVKVIQKLETKLDKLEEEVNKKVPKTEIVKDNSNG